MHLECTFEILRIHHELPLDCNPRNHVGRNHYSKDYYCTARFHLHHKQIFNLLTSFYPKHAWAANDLMHSHWVWGQPGNVSPQSEDGSIAPKYREEFPEILKTSSETGTKNWNIGNSIMKAKIKIIYIINIVKSSRLQYETKLHVNKTQPFHNTENADVLFFSECPVFPQPCPNILDMLVIR